MKKLLVLITTLIVLVCAGCSKEKTLESYDEIIRNLGNSSLTNSWKLKGNRIFGEDDYTGTYEVLYKKFSGEEIVFGGTTIKREPENIHVKIKIKDSEGNIKIMMNLKEQTEVLALEDGIYEYDFNVKDGSNYLVIEAEEYSGKIKIESNSL